MISRNVNDMYIDLVKSQSDTVIDHSDNVPRYIELLSRQIAKDYPELKIDDIFIYCIKRASLIHDIGKKNIPFHILSKPSKLTDEEYDIIKNHCHEGVEICNGFFKIGISENDKKFLDICKNVTLYHHERIDGSGYPYSLNKEEIPVEAQIMAIIDSFDAMTTERCYKKPMDKNKAINILMTEENKYNNDFLKSFEKIRKEIIKTN